MCREADFKIMLVPQKRAAFRGSAAVSVIEQVPGWTVQNGQLQLTEQSLPAPAAGEISIQVHACGVNRADLAQRAGFYPPPPGASEVLGLECAGRVEVVGEGVQGFAPGQEVCALLSGGGCATKVVCPAVQAAPLPAGMDFISAAALPEVFATAWLNLYMEAALAKGEKVLLHAGGSGVGTAAIQLCCALGQTCFVTAGSREKIDRCLALGASGGAVRTDGDWVAAVGQWAPDGVDVILDPVGGEYLAANLKVLATGGRLVVIGLMGGAHAELHLGRMMVKRLRLIGSTLRARPAEEKGRIMAQLVSHVWPHIAKGVIAPVIDRVFGWEELDKAHQHMDANRNFGKILLTVPPA